MAGETSEELSPAELAEVVRFGIHPELNADAKSRTHCKECCEGKHGACNGSMYVEDLDLFEACGCAAYDWNGEHTAGRAS